MAIIDCKEKMEMIKKIIEYYLNYVVEMNFESISNHHLSNNNFSESPEKN
jgi:hypothetical protein